MRHFNLTLLTPALLTLAAAPLAAQVKIHLKPESLFRGQSAELHAFLEGSWWQPDWNWSLPDPDNGRVERGPDGIWHYLAAEDFLLSPRKVRIRVAPTDGSHPPVEATLTLCAKPPLDFLFQACGYHPGRLDEPVASLLAGDPGKEESAAGKAQQARFQGITRLAWTGDHPDPDLARKWLVVDYSARRVLAMDGAGTVRPWLDHQESDHLGRTGLESCFNNLRSVSVRPTGQGPWRAVLASPIQHVILAVDGKGQVTTLAGADVPGFEDWQAGPPLPAGAGRLRGIPCLRNPIGLTVHRDKLYIADFCNHAVRVLDLNTFELVTLAGDPGQEAFRPGPLRDGRPRDPERFAALPKPFHVAFDDQGHCLVAIGWEVSCIAELSLAGLLASHPAGESKATPAPTE